MKNKIILLGLVVAVIIIAALLYILPGLVKQSAPENQQTTAVTDIKTPQQAADLQKDTASIVREIDDTLNNIENTLPDV